MDDEAFEPKIITPAERQAKKIARQVEAENAMSDLAKAQKVFDANRERLKAERLARETEGKAMGKAKGK